MVHQQNVEVRNVESKKHRRTKSQMGQNAKLRKADWDKMLNGIKKVESKNAE
jgi:hypothetical protein